jgi:ABC-type multidrug transport system fused ATPase/permease subunit
MTIFQLFRKISPFVKPYRWLVLGTLLLTIVGSFLAQVNAHVLRYTVDSISTLIAEGATLTSGYHILATISIILLSKEIIFALVQFGQKFYGEKLRIEISRDLAQLIVEKILSYRMAFYTSSENESGKLQTRIDMGISSLTRLVQNFFIDILPLFANSITALIFMFLANVYIGITSLLIIPLYFYIGKLQAKKLSGFRRRMRTFRETKNNSIISLIESITVIKSFVNESAESTKHRNIQYNITENQMQTRKLSFLFDSVKVFLEQFGVVAIILLTAYFVLNGTMSIGAIMFHILLFNNVSAPIRQLHRIYDEINDALIYSEGFFDIVEAADEQETGGHLQPENIQGSFRLNNVSFRYPNGNQALQNVSVDIPANKITALVGLSGAGKSTLINLLDKLYEPDSGSIILDGTDLRDIDTHYLRKNIGIVLQKNHIFQGSIRENIQYGKPDATQEEVEQAARKAYIHEQIMQLNNGYDADARQLSGGQQQRIAIARLFLKDPAIIFLDEPTASLDAIATEQIKLSLDAIKKNRTVIIISHSIAQIIDAENIIVMEKGSVAEQGTHEALFAKEGAYYQIFTAMANSLNIGKINKTMGDGS